MGSEMCIRDSLLAQRRAAGLAAAGEANGATTAMYAGRIADRLIQELAAGRTVLVSQAVYDPAGAVTDITPDVLDQLGLLAFSQESADQPVFRTEFERSGMYRVAEQAWKDHQSAPLTPATEPRGIYDPLVP